MNKTSNKKRRDAPIFLYANKALKAWVKKESEKEGLSISTFVVKILQAVKNASK